MVRVDTSVDTSVDGFSLWWCASLAAQDPSPLADYASVPGLTFADALDVALDDTRPEPHTSATATPFTSRHANPFLFATTTYQRVSQRDGNTWRPHVSPDPVLEVRTPPANPRSSPSSVKSQPAQRLLSEVQMSALETLRALGAALAQDFTAIELRREYRRLARRIHPDSHPGCSRTESERLSRQFASATASYQRLLAIVDPRH